MGQSPSAHPRYGPGQVYWHYGVVEDEAQERTKNRTDEPTIHTLSTMNAGKKVLLDLQAVLRRTELPLLVGVGGDELTCIGQVDLD
jgi:hypothetical protein